MVKFIRQLASIELNLFKCYKSWATIVKFVRRLAGELCYYTWILTADVKASLPSGRCTLWVRKPRMMVGALRSSMTQLNPGSMLVPHHPTPLFKRIICKNFFKLSST